MPKITLEIWGAKRGPTGFVFNPADIEDRTFVDEDDAMAFIRTNGGWCDFREIGTHPIPRECSRLRDFMYPQCEHGMSQPLCKGPNHFLSTPPAAPKGGTGF